MSLTLKELEIFAAEIRLECTKEIAHLGFGHLGGSLSIVDALAVLYGDVMRIRPEDPHWADRDLLVCSKGHAGPAVYATLALKGYFPMEMLQTLNTPGTRLPSHCDRLLTPGIDMTTGSLGQGVSSAIGLTLGKRMDKRDNYTYLIIGDGESNEGQVWEGAMFAGDQKLDHMIWLVDFNKKQLDGYLKDVVDIAPVKEKFEAFNFFVQDIDGHDLQAIKDALVKAKAQHEKPSCIILNTVKGKGVPALEAMELNHHIRMSKDFAEEAVRVCEERLAALKGEKA